LTDALLPRTDGSTARSPDRRASPRRDSHTRGQSEDCLPAHKSRRRLPPSSPGTDGHTPSETRTPSASLSTAFQRTSPTDGTHRPYPGRMGTAPAYPTLPSQSRDRLERCKSTDHRTHPLVAQRTGIAPARPPPPRDTQASHRSSTRGFGSTRAAQGAAVPLSTDTSTRLSRSSGSQPAQSPTVSHPRPPDTREHPGRSHRTRTIVPTDSVLSHLIGGTPARCHRTRTTSNQLTRTRPESRTSPRPMAPYADHRPQRLGTFALDRRHSSPMPPYPDHLHPTDSHSTRVSCSSQADATVRGGTSIDTALHRIARLSPGADGPKPARHQTTTPPRSGHPARSHRTRTTSTPPTRTRPESRARPRPMASHAEVRPLKRHSTASPDSHPAPTSRSPPDTRLLPPHALATGRPAPHPPPHQSRRLRVCPPAQGAAVPLSTERHTTRPLIQLESGQGHRTDTPPTHRAESAGSPPLAARLHSHQPSPTVPKDRDGFFQEVLSPI